MLALAAAGATLVQAVTSFSLSQILSVAAQRAIAEMRKSVNDHVMRLPVRYFDTTQTGQLISRIMNDAEGIRNLIGTGLVQLTGGFVEGGLALGVLFWLNWRLTTVTLVVLVLFGGGMAYAFKRLRPIFRERGEIQAQVTGRLAQALGGVRVVKAYVAEEREQAVFASGVYRLFDNVAQDDHRHLGDHRRGHGHRRRHRRGHDPRRRPVDPVGRDDARRLHHVPVLHRP